MNAQWATLCSITAMEAVSSGQGIRSVQRVTMRLVPIPGMYLLPLTIYVLRHLLPLPSKTGCVYWTVGHPAYNVDVFLTFSLDLRPIVCATTDDIAQYWFSHMRAIFIAGSPMPGRLVRRYWQAVTERPNYAIGTWLGRTHRGGDWKVLCSGVSQTGITTCLQVLPCAAPRQVSLAPSEVPAEPSQHWEEYDIYFDEKMHLTKPVEVSESDTFDEEGVDFALITDGTRWKR